MHSHMQTSSGAQDLPLRPSAVTTMLEALHQHGVERPSLALAGQALSFPGPSELPAAHVVFQKPEHHPSSWLPLTLRDMAEAAPPR